jgi:hypothetical protein
MPLARHFAPIIAALLLAACGDTTPAVTPTPPPGTFSAEISGDVTVTMPPGEARFAFVEDVDTGTLIPAHNELLFYQFADGKLYQITLVFPLDAQSGFIFDRIPFNETNVWGALFSDYETEGAVIERDLIDYNTNVSGMFRFDEIGATISGRFQFMAQAEVDGETRQISAHGTFENVPYVEP